MKSEGGLVYLTSEEMAEADRSAIEEYGVDVLSLMENAGAAVANLARRVLGGDVAGRRVCCLVGKGNNGGDGLVAARHLHNWGADVKVVLGGEDVEFRETAARQLGVVKKMDIKTDGPEGGFGQAELLVDALLGYGSRGDPREPLKGLINRANSSRILILAVDIPSGLDATTGEPGEPCIAARWTVTLGLPKTGFLNPRSRRQVGELYVADISMPRDTYRKFAGASIDFGKDTLIKVDLG